MIGLEIQFSVILRVALLHRFYCIYLFDAEDFHLSRTMNELKIWSSRIFVHTYLNKNILQNISLVFSVACLVAKFTWTGDAHEVSF